MRSHPSSLPNGYVPLAAIDGALPWNAARCACGGLKDRRARGCRVCTRATDKKYCSGCSKTLAIDEFYRRSNGGIVSRCKGCVSVAGKAKSPQDKRRYQTNSRNRPGSRAAAVAYISRRRCEDPLFRLAERLRASIRQALRRNGGRKDGRTVELIGCSIAAFRAHIERQWRPSMSWDNYGPRRDCWQLDHIRPVASFDLSDPAQVQACFHFSNHQPLWAPDNASKGARWAA